MNESVGLVPAPTRNSLILTGLTLRTFSIADSVCVTPLVLHEALPARSPLKPASAEVTLNVALTLTDGGIGSLNDFDAPAPPDSTEVHPAGTERLSWRPVTGTSVVFRNVTTVS